jgi:UDP-N-acetylglucosamine 2-epimerase (non-hydrolysing)
MKIINCVGARPNFIKISPIIKEMQKHSEIEHLLVHTGQHYDASMSDCFFEDLKIPKPEINLSVGGGTDVEQIAKIMLKFGDVLARERPDCVLVVGDVNSTLACALTAAKLRIKVAHVEAGLRSGNLGMQEELNRILTDRISDYLFATTKDDVENLLREATTSDRIFLVGDVMVDALFSVVDKTEELMVLDRLGLSAGEYCVLTVHRAENVDNKYVLGEILDAVYELQKMFKVVFPMHPRTGKRVREFGFYGKLKSNKNLLVVEPLTYSDFIALVSKSRFVVTDSGGIQKETTILGIPCLTMRNETEWQLTLKEGTNTLVDARKRQIIQECKKILTHKKTTRKIPSLWDGKTAERIVKTLLTKESMH